MSKKIEIQPAIKEETKKLAIKMGILTLIMFAVFFVLHLIFPDRVPFDYTVILAGIIGSGVAVLNFFWMGVAVQALADSKDQDTGTKLFKANYRKRMIFMIVWCILALALPCFHGAAGVIPLLLPSLVIRLGGAKDALKDTFKKKKGDD